MFNLFGTDGIRGKAGSLFTIDFVKEFARVLSTYFSENNRSIVIGRDTRESGYYIYHLMVGVFLYHGIDVLDAGIVSTPLLSYLTSSNNATFGLMITASHNAADDNGIKVFDSQGNKISDDMKIDIEKNMFISYENKYCYHFGKVKDIHYQAEERIRELINCFDYAINTHRILVDCANGSIGVFKELMPHECEYINCGDGRYINFECGSQHIEKTLEAYGTNYDIVFAFDGDGDRLVVGLPNKTILRGEELLYVFARYLKSKGKLTAYSFVTTKEVNNGLIESLKDFGICGFKTETGDSNVVALMNELEIDLGGESCGHIVIPRYSKIGDGVVSMLLLLQILSEHSFDFSTLLMGLHKWPKKNVDIDVNEKKQIMKDPYLSSFLFNTKSVLGDEILVLVRASGTENKIRVSVQSKDKDDCLNVANLIANYISFLDQGGQL